MKKLFVFLLILIAFSGFSADLVKDGKPVANIVLSLNPTRSARLAAAELNYHIEKMTGVRLPVVTSPQNGKTNIFVGAGNGTPANDSFTKQEYLIRVKGNNIYLLGRDKQDFRSFDYQKPNTFPGECAGLLIARKFAFSYPNHQNSSAPHPGHALRSTDPC